jgi:adenosine deaminase
MKNETFIQNMPKVELHLHLEGSMEADMMLQLAQRNTISLPYQSIEEIKAAYQFTNLQDFLDIYYAGCQVLVTENDFYELTLAYLQRAHDENIQHAEMMFDPQSHTQRGIDLSTVMTGISKARNYALNQWNLSTVLILSFLRHLSEEEAFKVLEQALPYRLQFEAVGLDSSELGNPPEKFERVFEYAHSLGLKTVAHAGEEGPPEYIWKSLELLKIHRLDHGNNSMKDEALIKVLAEKEIGLTLCPLSNLKLCVIQNMEDHPLKKMLQLNLKATVNSDDPAYFGGYLTDNYLAVAQALEMNEAQIYQTALNAIEVSFASENRKIALTAQLQQYFKKA